MVITRTRSVRRVAFGGQRQRIALGQGTFGNPFLVVLDEPNSNLDSEGEVALTAAIKRIRQRGGIAVVVAHRPSALAAVDFMAVVQNGKMTAFGPKEEILGTSAQRPAVKSEDAVRLPVLQRV